MPEIRPGCEHYRTMNRESGESMNRLFQNAPIPLAVCLVLLSLLSSFSCTGDNPDFKVEHTGALKTMMHEGDLSATADLASFHDTEHLYGLGALENLKGEILVLAGQPTISTVADEQVRIDNSLNHRAALFVFASVSTWHPVPVPDTIRTVETLERFIMTAAGAASINTAEPFPFLLSGPADTLDWHVIDWAEGDSVHTHEKHRNSGLRGTLTGNNIEVLGFYSSHHHGVFTHRSTDVHMHAVAEDLAVAGHVDRLIPGAGMVLKLPG